MASALLNAYTERRSTTIGTAGMDDGLATTSDRSPTSWTTEFANLVRHANVRGEKVYAFIKGFSGYPVIVEAKATEWHLELTDTEGANWLFAHPSAVVLRWMRTQNDD